MYILTCTSDDRVCSNLIGAGIPGDIVNIVHYVYLGIQIIVPIMLIIFGMIDLAKALASQKEDEIKKAQSSLIKKAVVAVIVFLVFALVSFVFNFANSGNKDKDNIWNCVDAIINGDCGQRKETSFFSI